MLLYLCAFFIGYGYTFGGHEDGSEHSITVRNPQSYIGESFQKIVEE